ncbi:MAG: dUTP diphosphatase [Negativicutes bacterium]|nr:dUTP diphosphatase [Negativicutes bacterium]
MKQRGFEVVSAYRDAGITLPERKTPRSAGYDIAAADDTVIPAGEIVLIPTGIKAYMGPDEYLGVHIRSSLALNHKLSLINSQGIIDADYYDNPTNEGHILLAVINHGVNDIVIAKGTRIAQGIFYRYLTTDDDYGDIGGQLQRTGGFGSTGNS